MREVAPPAIFACCLLLVACCLLLVACCLLPREQEQKRFGLRPSHFSLNCHREVTKRKPPRVRAPCASCTRGPLRCSPDQGRCATRASMRSDMLAFPLIRFRSSALPRGPLFLRPGFLPGFRGGWCRKTCGWGTGAKPQARRAELAPLALRGGQPSRLGST